MLVVNDKPLGRRGVGWPRMVPHSMGMYLFGAYPTGVHLMGPLYLETFRFLNLGKSPYTPP